MSTSKIARKVTTSVLATLTLLSYAKLLHTIIAAMSVTYLDYPNGSTVAVWLYDGKIRYLREKHIPLFVTAIAFFVFLLFPYTLHACSFYYTRKLTCIPIVNRGSRGKGTHESTNSTHVCHSAEDILNTCHTDTGIQIEEHDSPLKGIIVDWQTAQINGIQTTFGSGRANELLRGCQVLLFEHILHFVHSFIRLFIDIRFIS